MGVGVARVDVERAAVVLDRLRRTARPQERAQILGPADMSEDVGQLLALCFVDALHQDGLSAVDQSLELIAGPATQAGAAKPFHRKLHLGLLHLGGSGRHRAGVFEELPGLRVSVLARLRPALLYEVFYLRELRAPVE